MKQLPTKESSREKCDAAIEHREGKLLMTVRLLSRRQVLLGAGGFGLAIPFLRSVLPRQVHAQVPGPERRFVAFATDHGAIAEDAMFPDELLLDESMQLYTGHTVRHGTLVRTESDGRASVSTILSGSAERLTPDIVARMNVLRGLDIPFYIAHHTGGHLGNFSRNDGNGSEGQAVQGDPMPTIDQIMAWSPRFYADTSSIVERVMVLGYGSRLSWNWSNPSNRSGEIEEIGSEGDPVSMFRRVFVPDEEDIGETPRAPIVDRVHESYRSLRQSNLRLSADDRRRLDDHMDRLSELERRLSASAVRRASCDGLTEPSRNTDDPTAYYAALNDVVVAAFLCGTSRLAVIKVNEAEFVPYDGDWHQEVAHEYGSAEPQRLLQEANQKAFEFAMLDLAHKLNVEEADGQTVLDSTLIQWSQESGDKTHNARSIPVVTIGGAGGNLKTGNYCDYRRKEDAGLIENGYGGYSGLLYAQWLSMAMQVMGVGTNEFQDIEHNAEQGYGHPYIAEDYERAEVDEVAEKASDPLPFIGV